MLLALGSLFGQGLIHGVGPDHCLAIGALATRGGMRRAFAVALRFGLAHTAVLAVCAAAASVAGVMIPARWESAMEVVGGVSLMALGAWTLFVPPSSEPHAHDGLGEHSHAPGEDVDHTHPTRRERRAGALSAMVGAVFGLSGVRGMLMVIPLALRQHGVALLTGVLLFGAGVVLSMALVGFAAQRAAGRARVAERTLQGVVGLASMACGAWWVVDHLPG